MVLTLNKFEDIHFESVFDIKASEYKNPNVHRGIFEINKDVFTENDFEKLREEISCNIRISKFKGFGFSLILNGCSVQDDIAVQWVDNTNRRGGACQWVIIANEELRRGISVHMWQKGSTTEIYESMIKELKDKGISFVNIIKEPTGIMKWVLRLNPLLRMQLYKPQI